MWDKIASEWSGGEEWCIKRKRCQKAEDKRDFVTFATISVNTLGRTQAKNWILHKVKQRKERAEDIGPARFVNFRSHRKYRGANVWRQ